jgi:hypothetical protein
VASSRNSEGLIAWLTARLLSPRITVHVSPEAFTFSSARGRLLLQTFLYLRDSPDSVRVVSVGEEPAETSAGIVRLELFGGAKRLGNGKARIGNAECLEAFLRFAIQKLWGRTLMVRPTVTVVGAENLDRILQGFQMPVLRQAFESAGAYSVAFEDSHGV